MFLKLLGAQMKMLIRNRGALAASILFPIFFAGMFGAATRISEGGTTLVVVNEGGESGEKFIGSLRETEGFRVKELDSRKELEAAFASPRVDGALILPDLSGEATLQFVFDEKNVTQLVRTQERVKAFVQRYNLELAGGTELLTVTISPLRTTGTRSAFQYALPHMIMFSVVFSALSFGGSQAVKYRQSGVFKRFMVTPASAKAFLLSEVVTRSLLAATQTVLVLLVGVLIERALPPPEVLWLVPLAAMGAVIFINLGFVAAGISGNPEAVAGLTSVLGTTLIVLGGGVFQSSAPLAVKQVLEILPIQPILNAMLGVVSSRVSPVKAAPAETAILVAWVLGTFLMAFNMFRFRAPTKR